MSSEIRAQKKQSSEPPSIRSLPDDVIIDILACVPRCNYPSLSLVSKHFQSLVSSSQIYARRSLLGCTEACIYVFLYNIDTMEKNLYILRRKGNINRLILVQSLSPMPSQGGFVLVGSKIYVIGATYGKDMMSRKDVLSINCRSHTVQPFPSLPMPMANIVAHIIDGKFYVVGKSNEDLSKLVMVVFNTKTRMWEPMITDPRMDLSQLLFGLHSVVMASKMYIKYAHRTFVYMPKENKWKTEKMLNSKRWENACVIDDVLYCYDYHLNELRSYDPKERLWGVVKFLEELLMPKGAYPMSSHAVNYGGKLVVFLHHRYHNGTRDHIWSAEIALERRQGGEVFGKVEWSGVVIEGSFCLAKSLVVRV